MTWMSYKRLTQEHPNSLKLDTFESVRRRHPHTAPFSLSGLNSSIEDWEDRADRSTGEMDLFLFCSLFGRLRSTDIFLGRSGHKPNSFTGAGLSTVPTGKTSKPSLTFRVVMLWWERPSLVSGMAIFSGFPGWLFVAFIFSSISSCVLSVQAEGHGFEGGGWLCTKARNGTAFESRGVSDLFEVLLRCISTALAGQENPLPPYPSLLDSEVLGVSPSVMSSFARWRVRGCSWPISAAWNLRCACIESRTSMLLAQGDGPGVGYGALQFPPMIIVRRLTRLLEGWGGNWSIEAEFELFPAWWARCGGATGSTKT